MGRPLSLGTRAIARNLGWMLASRGVLAVLSLIYLAIVTRTLGLADFGRFALISGAAQALAVLVGFQTWQIIVRYGTDPLHNGDLPRLGRLLRACAWLDAGSAVAGALITIVVLAFWRDALGLSPDQTQATLIFTLVQLLSIRSTALGILRLRDRFSLAAIADSVTPATRLVGAAAAALFLPTVTGFLIAWGAAEIFTAAAYWAFLVGSGDLRLMAQARGSHHVIRDHPGIIRFALGTNANSTLGLSTKQVPVLLVGGSVGPAAAGAFRLALQVAQALTKLSQLLARAAFPEIVRAVSAGNSRHVGRLVLRSCLLASAVALVVFLLVLVAGRPLLMLMGGREFRAAYPMLLWLAAAGSIDLVTAGFEPLLMAVNRIGITFAARLAGMIALLAISFALAERWAVTGTAIAVLGNSLIVAILLGVATLLQFRGNSPGKVPDLPPEEG